MVACICTFTLAFECVYVILGVYVCVHISPSKMTQGGSPSGNRPMSRASCGPQSAGWRWSACQTRAPESLLKGPQMTPGYFVSFWRGCCPLL